MCVCRGYACIDYPLPFLVSFSVHLPLTRKYGFSVETKEVCISMDCATPCCRIVVVTHANISVIEHHQACHHAIQLRATLILKNHDLINKVSMTVAIHYDSSSGDPSRLGLIGSIVLSTTLHTTELTILLDTLPQPCHTDVYMYTVQHVGKIMQEHLCAVYIFP